jgi:hypothetical protein
LRGQKIALRGDFLPRSLPVANSIYPPLADSNGNSAIHGALRGDFLPRNLPAANSIYPPLADSE